MRQSFPVIYEENAVTSDFSSGLLPFPCPLHAANRVTLPKGGGKRRKADRTNTVLFAREIRYGASGGVRRARTRVC